MVNMIVLPQDQIDEMKKIMDFILKNPLVSVAEIKEHFDLLSEEYEMIFDLCMPSIRRKNSEKYWRAKYSGVMSFLKEQLRKAINTGNKIEFFKSILAYYSVNCGTKETIE